MYISGPPAGWKEVEEAELERYLGECPDFRSTACANHRRFTFAHNGKEFACVHYGKCYADPKLLVPHEKESTQAT